MKESQSNKIITKYKKIAKDSPIEIPLEHIQIIKTNNLNHFLFERTPCVVDDFPYNTKSQL